MLDYFIVVFLLLLAGYCHVLANRLKKLKLGSVQINKLINKLSAVLISAKKSGDEIMHIVNDMNKKLHTAKSDTTVILDDLQFMVHRAEKVMDNLLGVIENDRRMRNSDKPYNFRELLLKMAK